MLQHNHLEIEVRRSLTAYLRERGETPSEALTKVDAKEKEAVAFIEEKLAKVSGSASNREQVMREQLLIQQAFRDLKEWSGSNL